MRFLSPGFIATLAASAQGVLLPATTTADDSHAELKPAESVVFPHGQLAVPCADCTFRIADLTGKVQTYQQPSRLLIDVALRKESPNVLTLNDVPIWPADETVLATGSITLLMPQVVELMPARWQLVGDMPVSCYITYGDFSTLRGEPSLIDIALDIVTVAGRPVFNVPGLRMELQLQPDGNVSIEEAYLTEAASTATTPQDAPSEDSCQDAMCKLRAAIKQAMGRFQGCGGRMAAHGQSGAPQHPHHAHAHANLDGNRYMRIMRAFAFHVLLPISIGVMAGISASLVGMIVGQLIVVIYQALFRRGDQFGDVEEDEEEELLDDKVDHVMIVSSGGPPTYEDLDLNEKQTLCVELEPVDVTIIEEIKRS